MGITLCYTRDKKQSKQKDGKKDKKKNRESTSKIEYMEEVG